MKFVLCLLTLCLSYVYTQASELKKDNTEDWRYDIECAGSGSQGSYLVRVWSYGKKPNIPSDDMKRNAVHGVIFKGFSGDRGCTSQKPMAASPAVMEEKADFFKAFFADGGTCLKYADIVGTPEIIKVGKEYKVGVIVSVSKDVLRKDLEGAGVVKSLSSGF
ncbi:hypothetical protein SAMN05444362_10169 [Dysgonomonas macrotermitis]|uniref:Uncharacterized protein n=2 Tax=Dysgonomonas macrotermitis TaxID=1346286 RepID=A0A1M4SIP2_9BACT|nr:hypothetical protein SAMN05444362_10169 [Dysgonomonas macrotermitis]